MRAIMRSTYILVYQMKHDWPGDKAYQRIFIKCQASKFLVTAKVKTSHVMYLVLR